MRTRFSILFAFFASACALEGAIASLNPADGSIGTKTYKAEGVTLAPDFRLEMLYEVPAGQGSWTGMCFDSKGRLIVGSQRGAMYRVTVPKIGGTERAKVELIDVWDKGEVDGLLYAFDSLYVFSSGTGLYRLRDTNRDDKFDQVRVLRNVVGAGEHGQHSLALSPDGKSIYASLGNYGRISEPDSSRVPLIWGEDNLVPRLDTGFMDNSMAPQGWIAKTDPEGKTWEVFSVGYRNPWDLAFNRAGELFTFDDFYDAEAGAPWFRPARIAHVISGEDFGFRNGSGKWPSYNLDSFGSLMDIGRGIPTAMTFGTGARFPAKYQNALFVCDWTNATMYALHLKPDGSSYTGAAEKFLSGKPMGISDVLINPADGAMYIMIGWRNTPSVLYRVTYAGTESTAPAKLDSSNQALRDVRRNLEGFHGRKDPKAIEAAWNYLGDDDRGTRYAARTAVEWQDPALWREKALAESNPRKAIAALAALARVSGRDDRRTPTNVAPAPAMKGPILTALNRIKWPEVNVEEQLDLLRAYGLTFTRLGAPDEAMRQQLVAKFEPLFPASYREVNFELSDLLAYLQAPSAAAKLVTAMREAPVPEYFFRPPEADPISRGLGLTEAQLRRQEEQMHDAMNLRLLKTGWTVGLREDYFRWFVKAYSDFKGGTSLINMIVSVRSQALATMSDEEKMAIKDVIALAPNRTAPAVSGRGGRGADQSGSAP